MKVIIFGATGTTGRHLVDEAVAAGHEVTAFTRDAARVERDVRVIEGDVRALDDVRAAVQGHDAVIVALGMPASDGSGLREAGTRNIVTAMEECGVSRIICMSCLGVGDSYAAQDLFTRLVVLRLWLRRAVADHEAQEAVVRGSGLRWTLVRPPHLTKRRGGAVQAGWPMDQRPPAMTVGTADLAAFMVGCATDQRHVGETVGVCA